MIHFEHYLGGKPFDIAHPRNEAEINFMRNYNKIVARLGRGIFEATGVIVIEASEEHARYPQFLHDNMQLTIYSDREQTDRIKEMLKKRTA